MFPLRNVTLLLLSLFAASGQTNTNKAVTPKPITFQSVNYEDWSGAMGRLVEVNYGLSTPDEDKYFSHLHGKQREFWPGDLVFNVTGSITHKDADDQKTITKLSGILFNDDRTVSGSWLYSTNCHLPRTDIQKILKTFKKPIRTGEPAKEATLPKIWLFAIQKDGTLKFVP